MKHSATLKRHDTALSRRDQCFREEVQGPARKIPISRAPSATETKAEVGYRSACALRTSNAAMTSITHPRGSGRASSRGGWGSLG